MRRGLMAWDPAELPKGTLDTRVARLQAAMRRDGLDAFLIYTNLVRPSGVSWLTGFTPYWIESLLLVPKEGAPSLATALSKRVSDWIRSTSRVEEIVNTPKPGAAIGQRLAASGTARVGVLELDALPAGLYDDVVAAAPAVALIDGSATFAACRRAIDEAERNLLLRADAIAVAALDQVDSAQVADAGALAGLVEKHARIDAAEEVHIAVAPDLAADRRLIRVAQGIPLTERFAVRASVAYKGSWVRRTRSFARDAAGQRAYARAEAWLTQTMSALAPNLPLSRQLAERVGALSGAELKSWMAESCVGSYPLEAVASSRLAGRDIVPAGAFIVLSVELTIDGVRWLGAAPAPSS